MVDAQKLRKDALVEIRRLSPKDRIAQTLVASVEKLLEERPAIEGIALPGMPAGSPGMGGDKQAPFVIYAILDGTVEEFMTV